MTITSSSDSILEVQGLTKYFPVGFFMGKKSVHAVENLSFKVGKGKVVALVG